MKIHITSINGTMGKIIEKAIKNNNFEIEDENMDIIIDFSNPKKLDNVLSLGLNKNIPIVIGTTGYSEEEINKIKEASKKIPILLSFNMSFGINLINRILKNYIKALEENYDIELIEKHHNKKIDAPSGTCKIFLNTILDNSNNENEIVYNRENKNIKRKKREIGVHTIRLGAVVGEHEILFGNESEIIKLSHSALDKSIFANGAILGAKFLINKKPRLYSMEDILNFKEEK